MGIAGVVPGGYVRHDPTHTALYDLVAKHLHTFVRFAEERAGKPLPRYVVHEFQGYLRCGVLAHGFGRARCPDCGHDLFVAFSCTLRGVCPSCGGRRMAATAAHVVDHVLPDVPLRQWVVSVPYARRPLLAADPALLTLTSRVFFEELRRWYRSASGVEPTDDARVETGAITFVHRGGGSLNLHVHLHVLVADGVWRCSCDGSVPDFLAVRAPTRADLEGLLVRVARRVAAGIEHAGGLGPANDDALAACHRAAAQRGTYGTVRAADTPDAHAVVDADDARFGRRVPRNQAGTLEGFNLHASVVIGAHDREGRERLIRYVARPMVVNERVTELADGRIAWRLKVPGRGADGATHRIMEPMEFMARLAGLVPPPRYPLVRYHGVLAPNSPWRGAVVPTPPGTHGPCVGAAATTLPRRTADAPQPAVPDDDPWREERPPPTPRVRIDWATLMHRVWGWDVLACPNCTGRMRFIAVITQRDVIVRILTHVGLPATPVVAAPARRWDDTS